MELWWLWRGATDASAKSTSAVPPRLIPSPGPGTNRLVSFAQRARTHSQFSAKTARCRDLGYAIEGFHLGAPPIPLYRSSHRPKPHFTERFCAFDPSHGTSQGRPEKAKG